LISVTQTNDITFRRRATEALGDYPASSVTNTLTLLLADTNASVREEAARALERVKNKIGDSPVSVFNVLI
jgi:HEAT repeat protein